MTGCPIDTTEMREQAKRTAKDLDAQMCFEDEDTLGAALSAAMDMSKDVLTLCDALDAARAEIERVRTLLVLERRERPNKYGPDYRGDGSWEIAREALGEEKKQR